MIRVIDREAARNDPAKHDRNATLPDLPAEYLIRWPNAVRTAHNDYGLADIPVHEFRQSLWELYEWLESVPCISAAREATETDANVSIPMTNRSGAGNE
jgi:hypothetical protein